VLGNNWRQFQVGNQITIEGVHYASAFVENLREGVATHYSVMGSFYSFEVNFHVTPLYRPYIGAHKSYDMLAIGFFLLA
jgi:hypothetical protein